MYSDMSLSSGGKPQSPLADDVESRRLMSDVEPEDAYQPKYFTSLTSSAQRRRPGLSTALAAALVISALLNIYQATAVKPDVQGKAFMKEHPANIEQIMSWNSEYSSTNDTEVDRLWRDTVPWESGIVALTHDEAQERGLPRAQPFPWDPNNKELYIINAHHMLHCIRNLYISIAEYRQGIDQSISHAHVLHCLDQIRRDSICTADSTLRYVPDDEQAKRHMKPGDGQERTCGDWEQLQSFARAHDPCYRYVNPQNKDLDIMERFKYCPQDSPYLAKIRQYFGYNSDWQPV